MASKKTIEEFFKEELQTSGGANIYTDLFLYKDKQLLKENRLREFAEHQIDKAKNIFWSVSFSVFIGTLYAFWYLIEFGMSWHWSDLTIGVVAWALLVYALIKACKEYYSITSSMTLLIKLLDEEAAETD